MTATDSTARTRILVAIDIAKAKHEILVELPNGKLRQMIVRNQLNDFRQLAGYLKRLEGVLEIALKPTADYSNGAVVKKQLRHQMHVPLDVSTRLESPANTA